MTATHATYSSSPSAPVLYLALELGWKEWKLASTFGVGQKPRIVTIEARCPELVLKEISKAKKRFGLRDNAPVVSCYEAGREGFWLHRFLLDYGVESIVVDSSSIEVNRRKRRAKSDRLDAIKLVSMLYRWHNGDKKVWSVVHVPTVADEDGRQLHREQVELKCERTKLVNLIKGLCASFGLDIVVDAGLPEEIDTLRQWDAAELPKGVKQRILNAYERWQLVSSQIRELENERARKIRTDTSTQAEMTAQAHDQRGHWRERRVAVGS